MWASEKPCRSKTRSSLTSSSSTSSSISSSIAPSPFSQQLVPINPTSSSLEDVWKDVEFSSLNVNHSSKDNNVLNANAASAAAAFSPPPVIFQDFFVKESLVKVGSSTVPPADTFLSLTPGPPAGFNRFKEKQLLQPPLLKSHSLSDSTGFCSGSGSGSGIGVKRDMDPNNDSVGDHRHKRMIKNRESACRSRGRKQAYTSELELAVTKLKKENATLKAQLNQFQLAAAAQQCSSRNQRHKRTSTAPF